ncbi:MAG: hypothetical protein V5A61_00915 [Haloarculaceae archaeon]
MGFLRRSLVLGEGLLGLLLALLPSFLGGLLVFELLLQFVLPLSLLLLEALLVAPLFRVWHGSSLRSLPTRGFMDCANAP